MGTIVVHFAVFAVVDRDTKVTPLCGDWRTSPNWTTARGAVTCPACLRRLREQATRGGEARDRPAPGGAATDA